MEPTNFNDFLQSVEKDPAMKERFSKVQNASQMVEFAGKLGYTFTEDEVQQQVNALGLDLMSEDDISNISGGQSVVAKPSSNYWFSGD
jgi:predicted ribosomally synthesized peptide with nif11-like leader